MSGGIRITEQAARALRALQAASQAGSRSLGRMASGLRNSDANSDASYWSIAKAMSTDRKMYVAAADALHVTLGAVDVAISTSTGVFGHLDAIRQDLLLAYDGQQNLSRVKRLDADLLAHSSAIADIVISANYNGVNLIYRRTGQPTTLTIGSPVLARTFGASNPATINTVDYALIDDSPNTGILSQSYNDPTNYSWPRKLLSQFGPASWQLSIIKPTGVVSDNTQLEIQTKWIEQMRAGAEGVYASLGALKSRLER